MRMESLYLVKMVDTKGRVNQVRAPRSALYDLQTLCAVNKRVMCTMYLGLCLMDGDVIQEVYC